LIFSQILHAQFSISGTVRDQQAASVVKGASVRLSSITDGGFSRSLLSDSMGRFVFQNLPADSFSLLFPS
jgi:hypothetical protein